MKGILFTHKRQKTVVRRLGVGAKLAGSALQSDICMKVRDG